MKHMCSPPSDDPKLFLTEHERESCSLRSAGGHVQTGLQEAQEVRALGESGERT